LTTLQYRSASAPSSTRTIMVDEYKFSAIWRLSRRKSRPIEKFHFYLRLLSLATSFCAVLLQLQQDLRHQKTTVPGLSCGVCYTMTSLAVLIELLLVTDGQTDTGP